MAKEKKKKKKKKDKKKGQELQLKNTFAAALNSDRAKTAAPRTSAPLFSSMTAPGSTTPSDGSLPQGVTLGEPVDRSTDKLFIGTDYKKVFNRQYERSWEEILNDISQWHAMPFTMGIEMELIIANDKGEYLPGDDMVYRMKEIVKDAIKSMREILYENKQGFLPIPDYIRKKVLVQPYFKDDIEKGGVLVIKYQLPEGNVAPDVAVDCFGRDGNVTAITYILELVTPPCQYVEELAYWASTLFLLAKTTLPKDLHIIASAINPAAKEYMRGLTQADHYHIAGFVNETEKGQVYSMLRNFIPHIISLSVNSPIMDNKPTDTVKIINKRITAPNCIRSLRLKYNASMLSSNEPKGFLPYLTTADKTGEDTFLQAVQKASLEDGRMQDIFPFTEYGTIEFRVCDAQISICRRIGMGMIIQALAYKTRKLLQKGTWVPDAGAETISYNRKGAYERGLISLFRPQNIDRAKLKQYDPDFAEQYLGPENDPIRYMTQAVQRLFLYIKPELQELNYLYSPFLKPLLMSVFGDVSYALAPITESEYQLSLYDYKVQAGEEPNVLYDLIYFTIQYCQDPLNNPLTGDLTLPKEMR